MDEGCCLSASNKIGDRLIAAAQVAGVLATAWFVSTEAVLPKLSHQSLGGLVLESMFYVALAWFFAAVITFCIYLVVSLADLPGVIRFSLRTSAAAMWFAPSIVLLTAPGPAAFAVSLFLVANATRHLVAQWGVIESPIDRRPAARVQPPYLFRAAGPDTAFLSWNAAPVMMGSFAAQAGFVAMLWQSWFLSAALFAVSTAILTSLSLASGAYRPPKPPPLPHSALSVALTFLLAAALTAGGIAARGRGGAQSAAASSSPDSGGPPGADRVTQAASPSKESYGFGGDFPGVVLLPELKPNATLLMPVLSTPRPFGLPILRPVGIPFTGDYWMFRPPFRRPPPTALVRRGSPSELSFHTTDGWPMAMEAHQKLDPPVDIKCCSRILLAIRNSDPYPGTVSLELILVDTTDPMSLGQSLGTASAPLPPPTGQILSFRMPPVSALRKFDELKVVFQRDPARADKSARIAIERFVLAP